MSGAAAVNAMLLMASAYQRQLREQEEEMPHFTPQDLNGWEFKILRYTKIGGLKDSVVLQKVLAEEAQAGWELVEKFDDFRLRLKRRISERENDKNHLIDPYRAYCGPSQTAWAIGIMLGSLFIALIFVLLAVFATNR